MFEQRGWDDGLDDAQLAAATHGDGPLVIIAGAGTGKTRTLTARVAHLVDRGVPPERILLLTFTRRAADDMIGRAAASCTRPDAGRRIQGGTFHAVAHRLIAPHTRALGLPEALSVLDRADAADAIDLLRPEFFGTGPRQRADAAVAPPTRLPQAGTLVDAYSRAVNTGRPARDVIAVDYPWLEPHVEAVLALFKAYIARKRARGLLDFDDLLLAWRSLLADPTLGPTIGAQWDHVLVDEYQDVNRVQVDIVRALRPDGSGLTVVGDDAQAVYGFRGADSAHLHDVAATYPATTVVCLERNFRSRQRLLDLANVVRPGYPLTLRSDRTGGRRGRLVHCHDAPGEARAVADAVLGAVEEGRRLREQAVLMRTGHHSDLLEVELTARRVPFVKFGGLKFLESAHVKDFLAALRVLDNRIDEVAWFRLLRLHDGLGPARARDLLTELAGPEHPSDGAAARAVAAAPSRARMGLAATLDALHEARATPGVADRAAACVRLLRPLLTARYPDAVTRLGDLDRLAAAAATAPDLAGYVAELTLDPPASTADLAGPPHLDEDYLTLSTVHSAKGLEWPIVHVIHAVDGAFPSDMALTSEQGLLEEQRLFYVAVTRAADELSVYAPLRMPHHRHARDDRHSLAPVSRFLDAPARAVLDVTEVTPPRPAVAVTSGAGRVAIPDLDELWA